MNYNCCPHEAESITKFCCTVCVLSHVWLFMTPWTVAHKVPPPVGFYRQGSWSGVPFPPPRYHLDPEIEPASLESPASAGEFSTTEPLGNPKFCRLYQLFFISILCSLVPLPQPRCQFSPYHLSLDDRNRPFHLHGLQAHLPLTYLQAAACMTYCTKSYQVPTLLKIPHKFLMANLQEKNLECIYYREGCYDLISTACSPLMSRQKGTWALKHSAGSSQYPLNIDSPKWAKRNGMDVGLAKTYSHRNLSNSKTPSAEDFWNTVGCLELPKVENLSGKEFTCQSRRHRRHRFDPCFGKIPWRRKWQPTPVFLPGEFHGQRSLAC